MNLEKASVQHRNVVISFVSLLSFAMANDMGSKTDFSPIVVASAWGLIIYHSISVFLLAKYLEKSKILWCIAAILSPILLFIPTFVLSISSNRVFKANGWKVKFYGGAKQIAVDSLHSAPNGIIRIER